jgi:hypothetical protein
MNNETTPETLMTAAEITAGESSTTASATDASVTGDQQPETGSSTPPAEDQPATSGEEVDYAFTFEGDVDVDATSLEDLKALAKDLKLPIDQAQKIADLGQKQAQRWLQAQEQAIQDATAQWVEQVKTDKELGGEALNANLATAKTALNKFGSPELTKLLDESRLGNHPEVIRLFHRIGKAIGDDSLVPGGRTTNRPGNPAQRLYDNSNLS